MNHSIYSADRTTHLKILVAALVASIGFAAFGIALRVKACNECTEAVHIIKIKGHVPDRKFAAVLPVS